MNQLSNFPCPICKKHENMNFYTRCCGFYMHIECALMHKLKMCPSCKVELKMNYKMAISDGWHPPYHPYIIPIYRKDDIDANLKIDITLESKQNSLSKNH